MQVPGIQTLKSVFTLYCFKKIILKIHYFLTEIFRNYLPNALEMLEDVINISR
jgi:hypothetical protein